MNRDRFISIPIYHNSDLYRVCVCMHLVHKGENEIWEVFFFVVHTKSEKKKRKMYIQIKTTMTTTTTSYEPNVSHWPYFIWYATITKPEKDFGDDEKKWRNENAHTHTHTPRLFQQTNGTPKLFNGNKRTSRVRFIKLCFDRFFFFFPFRLINCKYSALNAVVALNFVQFLLFTGCSSCCLFIFWASLHSLSLSFSPLHIVFFG